MLDRYWLELLFIGLALATVGLYAVAIATGWQLVKEQLTEAADQANPPAALTVRVFLSVQRR